MPPFLNPRTGHRRDRPHTSSSSGGGSPSPSSRRPPRPEAAPTPSSQAATALPVDDARANIARLIRENPVCVIVGETGSGKSTKVPQFVLDDVLKGEGAVCCTQPRRVAATTIAQYVAKCRGGHIGGEVGYAVRFDEAVSSATKLKFVTDGILLREIMADSMLRKYQCVLLDEAHERTLHGDVLFGLLKQLKQRRKDLRIVIMSATLNADHFSRFWDGAPVGYVSGRTYPVEVFHTTEPQLDYVDALINTTVQVHLEQPFPGDVLCFLTGQDEIEDVKDMLEERRKLLPQDTPSFVVCPLYAAMAPQAQLKAFAAAPTGQRKIILATNIAETSITIEGIRYVIDSGVVKSREYDASTTLDSLVVIPTSRAQARQRMGRAGRVAAGKCFRLYSELSFEEDFVEDTIPEILRCNLSSVVLQMFSMGIHNVLEFDFMDPPKQTSLLRALQQLTLLGAVEQMRITALGKRMVQFPVDPMAAKAIVVAGDLGVTADVCAIMAMLSADAALFPGTSTASDVNRSKFNKTTGDHMTLLYIFDAYRSTPKKERATWCDAAGISAKQMSRVLDVFRQLVEVTIVQQHAAVQGARSSNGHHGTRAPAVDVAGAVAMPLSSDDRMRDHELARQALCHGYALHAAYFSLPSNGYKTMIGNTDVGIHPSSVLFQRAKRKPPTVLFHSMVRTSRVFMREIVAVEESWIRAACPLLFGAPKAGGHRTADDPTES